jgi:hypothetical protein
MTAQKLDILCDEWYPVYYLAANSRSAFDTGRQVELSAEEVEQYVDGRAFLAWQKRFVWMKTVRVRLIR